MNKNFDKRTFNLLKDLQQDEINSYEIYKRLSKRKKTKHNSQILNHISEDELSHFNSFYALTNISLKEQKFKIIFYYYITVIFGLTFGIKLMKRNGKKKQLQYKQISEKFPKILEIITDKNNHENELIDLLNDEMLIYVSSIVLGLNDALVELTGALAGFTFSLKNPNLIASAGIIVGLSAALSMAASEYLSQSENNDVIKSAFKASIYTGMSYFVVVIILILPFILLKNFYVLVPLIISLIFAIIVIFFFTYYVSIAKSTKFSKRFVEMVSLSMTVAIITLILGFFANSII